MRPILLATVLLATRALGQTTVTSIYPASGPASGGTIVHILGTDLIGLPLACPALSCSNYVQFGGTLSKITINSPGEIVVQTLAHTTGTVDVVVNVAGKATVTLPLSFRYDSPDATSYERVLVPIVIHHVPGAFGSIWESETSFSNSADADVTIFGPCAPPQALYGCTQIAVPKSRTFLVALRQQVSGAPGVFLFIPRNRIDDIDVKLRVQDVSRQALTWGTDIRVVRDTDFRSFIRLHNIPTDVRFRSTLRVYNYDPTAYPIRVRIFDEDSSALLVEDLPLVSFPGGASTDVFPVAPSFVQINSLTDAYPQIGGHDRVRVEVESAFDPAKPIWAFASITNNETQHVTVVTP